MDTEETDMSVFPKTLTEVNRFTRYVPLSAGSPSRTTPLNPYMDHLPGFGFFKSEGIPGYFIDHERRVQIADTGDCKFVFLKYFDLNLLKFLNFALHFPITEALPHIHKEQDRYEYNKHDKYKLFHLKHDFLISKLPDYPKLCTAGRRIFINLFRRGQYWFFGKYLYYRRAPTITDRLIYNKLKTTVPE